MGNSTATIRPEIISDLENCTSFSATEIGDLYRLYVQQCADLQTFEMTVGDFKKIYREVFPTGDADKFAENVFRTFDKQGNGRINFREFMMTLSVQLKGDMRQKLEWVFELYDKDKDGTISREQVLEMTMFFQSLNNKNRPQADVNVAARELTNHLFYHADHDKDNVITKQDFLQTALSSKVLQKLVEGTTDVASVPYNQRRERSGSIGLVRDGPRRGSITPNLAVPKESRRDSAARRGSNQFNPQDAFRPHYTEHVIGYSAEPEYTESM